VTEVTVGMDPRAAHLANGPIDDYETLDGELHEGLHKGKAVLYVDDLGVSWGAFLTTRSDSTRPKPLPLKVVK